MTRASYGSTSNSVIECCDLRIVSLIVDGCGHRIDLRRVLEIDYDSLVHQALTGRSGCF